MSDYDRVQQLEQQISLLQAEQFTLNGRISDHTVSLSNEQTARRLLSFLILLRTPRLEMAYELWCVAIVLLFPTAVAGLAVIVFKPFADSPVVAWLVLAVFLTSGLFITIALIAPSTIWLIEVLNRFSAREGAIRELTVQADQLAIAILDLKCQRDEVVNSIEFRRSKIENVARALLSQSWEGLQGCAFENFLVQVFENLGASVDLTPTTGDQGADLIVLLAGRKFAVQAKGGISVIGNRAVMAAIAGMHFYGCESAVVITNSTFTRKAEELAQRCSCLLIDGAGVIELAMGKHLTFQFQA